MKPGKEDAPPPQARDVPRFDSMRIDPAAECTYKTLTADESRRWSPLHCHDYFEMFLVTEGALLHIVNEGSEQLTEGDCVFIRPDDIHRFEPVTGSVGRFTNIEISRSTIDALRQFLGTALRIEEFLQPAMPPRVHLDSIEKARLQDQLWELNRLPLFDAAMAKMRLRSLLAYIFTSFFCHPHMERESSVPEWLRTLCFRMGYQPNIAAGVSRMVELSNKSPAYLSRVFRKHFNQTPSEYVNRARLNFAANLLAHTEYKIGWIARESGFPNVSNFYDQFRRVFKVTPAAFRRRSRGDSSSN